ncbi:MAG: hypothetical protein OEO20_14525 [Gemmatimonadota bacterium]|nr:hypothetical protein [Gemmatimonadota bacterium]MDH3367812.1 hypothetical protein [Gemmatimonadota bacterium]MDH3479509.1 hypothetical protein [Gemmatimonadota bacterium]MDH3570250.1 hypothetical protein [Gemmatimonadota bacterium]MDH5549629.1 hypothetical protein [Gemmatimonadota bacterium]
MLRARARFFYAAAAVTVGTLLAPRTVIAQFTEPPPAPAYALTGVTLIRPDGSRLASQTIVVRNGFIQTMGADVAVPPDAELLAGDSLMVFPGMIDAQGAAKVEFPEVEINRQEIEPWNPPRAVQGFMPHRRVADFLTATGKDLEKQRLGGVVAGAVHPDGPVMPGRGAVLVNRKGADVPTGLVLNPELGPVFTLQGARGAYPGTLFAVAAFIRQSLEDARHHGAHVAAYRRDPRGVAAPPWDPDYEVLRTVMTGQVPVFFAADKAEDIRLVLRLAEEYGFSPIIMGGDEAWKVSGPLKRRNVPVLVSLDFPEPKQWKPEKKKPEADQPDSVAPQAPKPLDAAAEREKRDLEQLYANPGKLAAAGVRFALTSGGGKADLRGGARKAIEYGLGEADALRALTVTPAELLGAPSLTRIESGLPATFVVADGPLFAEETKIAYTFVEGALDRGKPSAKPGSGEAPAVDMTGTWTVDIDAGGEGMGGRMTLEQDGAEFSGTLVIDMGTMQIQSGAVSGTSFTCTWVLSVGGETMEFDVKGTVEGDEASGTGGGPMGDFSWKARRTGTPERGNE